MSERNARFCYNNWLDATSMSTSSAQSSYPNTNLVSDIRSKVWKANGNFEISSTNNKLYVNSNTYTIASGSYTLTTLNTAITAALSIASIARNAYGIITLTLSSPGTFELATTSNAIWSTLGILSTTSTSGSTVVADERRYSTVEWIQADLLVPQEINFAALIPPSADVFSCPTATIKLRGNNSNSWVSPAIDLTMEVSSRGAFLATDEDLQPCRYWRIEITDVKNAEVSAAVAYIGTSVAQTNTNLSTGFSRSYNDQSIRMYSEGGQLYVDRKPRYLTISNAGIMFLKDEELIEMEQLIFDLGNGRPFFVCIDPQTLVSTTLDQMTHYVEVDGAPSLTHVINSYYNLSFNLREVL